MLSTIRAYRLKKIDYAAFAAISVSIIIASLIQSPLFIEKLFHLIPGTLIVFLLLKFLLSTDLAEKNFDKIIFAIFWFCLFYYIIYIAFSNPFTKGNDVIGHMRYIEAFSKGYLQNPGESWQSYHPPLFHLLSSAFLSLGEMIGLKQPFDMVRYFSLISYMIFLFYSALLYNLILNKKIYEYIALLLLVVWPIGIIFSSKINNDILIYSTVIAGLYYLVNWYKNNNKKHLWYAVNIGLLSITAKTSGLIFCFALFVCVMLKLKNKEITIHSIFSVKKSMIIFTIIFAIIALSTNFGRTLHYTLSTGISKNYIAGNVTAKATSSLNPGYIVDDNLKYYTTIDLEKYFNEPFVMLFSEDHQEKNYFWNVFIKSSITGVGKFIYGDFLRVINSTYLLLLLYILLSYAAILINDKKFILKSYTPLFILPVLALSGMIYMRSINHLTGYPQSRFIHYFVPILIIFLLKAIDYHKKKDRMILYYFGMALTCLIGLMFFIFMVSQFRLD